MAAICLLNNYRTCPTCFTRKMTVYQSAARYEERVSPADTPSIKRGLCSFTALHSRTCLAWKGFTKTKKRRPTGRQPGTKSTSRPAVRRVINRSSTGRCVPPSVPGHALHEKGLQKQISDGTLVSNKERRALAVPVINRGWAAGQPRNLFLRGFTYEFAWSCFRRVVQDSFLRCPRKQKNRWLPWRTDLSASRSARPGPACSLRRAPPRRDPPVVCLGLGFDKFT